MAAAENNADAAAKLLIEAKANLDTKNKVRRVRVDMRDGGVPRGPAISTSEASKHTAAQSTQPTLSTFSTATTATTATTAAVVV